MNDRYIFAVYDYALDQYEPKCAWPKDNFERYCYAKWAVDEILRYLMDRKDTHPIVVIEDFVSKMNAYSFANRKFSLMFSIARDIAEDILDMFRAME